jgi:hypothetical protein
MEIFKTRFTDDIQLGCLKAALWSSRRNHIMTHRSLVIGSFLRSFNVCLIMLLLATATVTNDVLAQNPIITNQFTADPAARVFEGRVYLYPSHDILAGEGRGRVGWFCMEDYHVFSSENLTDWTDHGVIVSQERVPWANSKSYSMWAPDCIDRSGKYYFYFPTLARDTTYGRGFSIGVAVSDKPYGPFVPQHEPIKNVHGIDPNPFIDKDGQVYLYWAARNFYVAKLKESMIELADAPRVIEGLPEKGLKEGPYVFERNGLYYMAYPHVEDRIERLEYAISRSPTGPFKYSGVIMDESPTGCWTSQLSIVEFRKQWYLFYHQNDLSPQFDKNRSVRIDSLFFNDNGTIRKVIPTLRGVGVTDGSQRIEVDRFTSVSEKGVTIDFLDTVNRFGGWKVVLDTRGAWVRYNGVDFGSKRLSTVEMRATSKTGGTVQVRLGDVNGTLIAEMRIPKSDAWEFTSSPLSAYQPGIKDVIVLLRENADVEIDWMKFR